MPKVALRTVGRVSVTTRRPPGRTVRRTVPAPPSVPLSRVRVVPGRCFAAEAWATGVPSNCCFTNRTSTNRVRPARAGKGVRAAGATGSSLGGGGLAALLALDDRDQRQLAARVDLGDLDLHLGADAEHVLDVLDALAAGQLADLRDVQQTVLARHERDEGAEGGGL